jgi:hypothetical protein
MWLICGRMNYPVRSPIMICSLMNDSGTLGMPGVGKPRGGRLGSPPKPEGLEAHFGGCQ